MADPSLLRPPGRRPVPGYQCRAHECPAGAMVDDRQIIRRESEGTSETDRPLCQAAGSPGVYSWRNWLKTFASSVDTLLSKLLKGRLPQNVIDPVEKTAPPDGVSK